MAGSASEIQLNYARAIEQAETLTEIAQNMRNKAGQDLEECLADIAGIWKSENAAAYFKKGEIIKEEILQNANQIEKAAEMIRQIAAKMRDAELAALKTAETREYA
ncbi:MAG: hypothetical protein Q4B26_03905 [Eubacteriales bacterium]|nr:hypothetical protein [Eubacteriales bacterium]